MIVGILGGGQLARMLALAGYPLGLEFLFLSPDPQACAAPLGRHICAAYDDESALAELAARADVITFEFENVPAQVLRFLAGKKTVRPSFEALTLAQDRLLEKRLFQELGIPIPSFAPVRSLPELDEALSEVGLPAVLKTRRQGYDGQGQAVLRRPQDLAPGWEQTGGAPAIVEAFVPFDREVSIIAARAAGGETAFYPLSENSHREGILRLSVCSPDDPMQELAEDHARRLLERLDYVGVLAIEFFQVGERLLANEFAPRVHNSGHWTIEGAECSQFENHLRAVAGLPLGSTAKLGESAMLNFIGRVPPVAQVMAIDDCHLHHYGKAFKDGRKVGHATLRSADRQTLQQAIAAVRALIDQA